MIIVPKCDMYPEDRSLVNLMLPQHDEDDENSFRARDSISRNRDDIFEMMCSNGKARRTRRRRIIFSDDHTVHQIPNRREMTSEEKSKCWYSPEETDKMQACNSQLVTRALAGESIDRRLHSLRGLEKQLRGNKSSPRFQEALTVVLETQDEFWCDQDTNGAWDLIASLYQTISRESASDAHLKARKDEKSAKRHCSC